MNKKYNVIANVKPDEFTSVMGVYLTKLNIESNFTSNYSFDILGDKESKEESKRIKLEIFSYYDENDKCILALYARLKPKTELSIGIYEN